MRMKTSFQTFKESDFEQVAARFRALGEASRLRLIFAARSGEKNVTQLIKVTGLSQANVSKHLKILTDSGILIRRKQGIYVFYSTTDSTAIKLCEVCRAGLRKDSGQAEFSNR